MWVAEREDVAGKRAHLTVGTHDGDHDRSRGFELPRRPRRTPPRDVSTAERRRDDDRHSPTDHLGSGVAEQRRRTLRPVRDSPAPVCHDECRVREIHFHLRGRVDRATLTRSRGHQTSRERSRSRTTRHERAQGGTSRHVVAVTFNPKVAGSIPARPTRLAGRISASLRSRKPLSRFPLRENP
jgi:hypothetical protein